MGIPARMTCLACNAVGPSPSQSNGNDESSFEVHGRYGGLGMFKCRKCEALNLMKFRLLFSSSFVDVIRPNDPRHATITKKHAELFADASATADDSSEDASSTPTSNSISAVLQRLGKAITEDDLLDASSAGGAELEFGALDRATQIVFDQLVKEQAKLLLDCFPSVVPSDARTLLSVVGGHLFMGFVVARRLFGTHKLIVGFSGDVADSVEKAAVLKGLCDNAYPDRLLEDAGDHFVEFLYKLAITQARLGIYADIPHPTAGPELLHNTMLNGWTLGVAEYQMTLPE